MKASKMDSRVGEGCRAFSRDSFKGLVWCVGDGSGVETWHSLKLSLVGERCGVPR